MTEALLYQKLPGNKVRCGVCQRRCLIAEGKTGYCQTRINHQGKLYSSIYGVVSSLNNDPIEKKPVFHFYPGSSCLSLGSFGCNFRCLFCQNWEISWADGVRESERSQRLAPAQVVALAQKYQSAGIALTYNEPAIWLEYALEVFKLAKTKKLYTVWVTNGYATPEALDIIAPYLDVYRVDLKSFADKFYQQLIKVPKAEPIFRTTKYLHDRYPQIHIECVTNIIPGWNDNPQMLKKIAAWIKNNLGPKTPWHLTRFFPCAELTNVPATPEKTLLAARKIGLQAGLQFVYLGNLEVDTEDDTFCPKCRTLVIKRDGYAVKILAVSKDGRCLKCDENLNIKR
jgi:pyruvate formate lyase activating enzyme